MKPPIFSTGSHQFFKNYIIANFISSVERLLSQSRKISSLYERFERLPEAKLMPMNCLNFTSAILFRSLCASQLSMSFSRTVRTCSSASFILSPIFLSISASPRRASQFSASMLRATLKSSKASSRRARCCSALQRIMNKGAFRAFSESASEQICSTALQSFNSINSRTSCSSSPCCSCGIK